ncbi:hypothetical protein BKA82DRAFT_4019688 [Pisolithus tinctorius]|nr:hypothetical protein BKA82DRAFT_4019688 [Pisolithus tinctorius]
MKVIASAVVLRSWTAKQGHFFDAMTFSNVDLLPPEMKNDPVQCPVLPNITSAFPMQQVRMVWLPILHGFTLERLDRKRTDNSFGGTDVTPFFVKLRMAMHFCGISQMLYAEAVGCHFQIDQSSLVCPMSEFSNTPEALLDLGSSEELSCQAGVFNPTSSDFSLQHVQAHPARRGMKSLPANYYLSLVGRDRTR